jgi:Asp-tRNA(Asn)/Glu-tRNA(Gln) amidotransferase C subunit
MKNLGKELNKVKKEVKRKLNKEDLKHFTPERIVKDLNMVEQLVSKMSNFDENIKEDEAEKLKGELEEIESYLLSQYKDYIDIDEKDIDLESFKNNLDSEE